MLLGRKNVASILIVLVLLVSAIGGREASVAKKTTDVEWTKSPTGSAGVLTGKSILVNIYATTKNSKWNVKSKKEANRKVKCAIDYIEKSAKKYGKHVTLIGDAEKNKDLNYSLKLQKRFTDSDRSQDKLYEKIKSYINKCVDVDKLREKYNTDSVGFLVHLNQEGVSSTLSHYADEGAETFYECSTLFTRCDKMPEGAATYAHEILHLFGARDLYEKSYEDGILKPFLKYIRKKHSTELMYTTLDRKGRQIKYRITNPISRITAYYLGWKKNIPEVKRFHLIPPDQPGCFGGGTRMS